MGILLLCDCKFSKAKDWKHIFLAEIAYIILTQTAD